MKTGVRLLSHHVHKITGARLSAAIHQITVETLNDASRAAPTAAELTALIKLKKAYSVAKTRPNTCFGTTCNSNWVEKTQTMPPPRPRNIVPSNTLPKLNNGAVSTRP